MDSIDVLKKANDRRKFIEEMKKNPKQEHEYLSELKGMGLDSKEYHKLHAEISTLKEQGLLIDDIPETFKDFQVRMKEQGRYGVKTSTIKIMEQEEFHKLMKKDIAFYPDMAQDKDVQHYEYEMTDGKTYRTGSGQSVSYAKCFDKKIIEAKAKEYQHAKAEVKKILIDLDVNGADYKDFHKDK